MSEDFIFDENLPSGIKKVYDKRDNQWCYFNNNFWRRGSRSDKWFKAKKVNLTPHRVQILASLFND